MTVHQAIEAPLTTASFKVEPPTAAISMAAGTDPAAGHREALQLAEPSTLAMGIIALLTLAAFQFARRLTPAAAIKPPKRASGAKKTKKTPPMRRRAA